MWERPRQPLSAPDLAYWRGQRAEARVAELLEAEGWSVLARNWRGAGGELDLVVLRDGVLRFVEVKARSARDGSDSGVESVGRGKQRRLTAAGRAWLAEHGPPQREVAFLVAVVTLDEEVAPATWAVEWWDDAF
jgi:putative endonuclease